MAKKPVKKKAAPKKATKKAVKKVAKKAPKKAAKPAAPKKKAPPVPAAPVAAPIELHDDPRNDPNWKDMDSPTRDAMLDDHQRQQDYAGTQHDATSSESAAPVSKVVSPELGVAALSDKEVAELAGKLHGSNANVYHKTLGLYGVTVGDEIFDRLETVGGVFRCENCDTWNTIDRRLPHLSHDSGTGFCDDCDPDEFDEDQDDNYD